MKTKYFIVDMWDNCCIDRNLTFDEAIEMLRYYHDRGRHTYGIVPEHCYKR